MKRVTQRELQAVDRTICLDGIYIFKKNCTYIHSGYYLDYLSRITRISRFSRPFCQDWPRYAPGLAGSCRWPFGYIDRSIPRSELSKEIVLRIAQDDEAGFCEPSNLEFIERITTTFKMVDPPAKYLESIAYLHILNEIYDESEIILEKLLKSDTNQIFTMDNKKECDKLHQLLNTGGDAAKKYLLDKTASRRSDLYKL